MKTHPSFAAVVTLIVGMAVGATGAPVEAATTVKSSKSNTSDRVIANASDEMKCVADGGTVVVRDGKKVCSLPASAQ
jgi:hypothetical protein